MSVTLKSSDVQQNFGKVMEHALAQEDVIVERYGEPRVAILSYQRYQHLLGLEQQDARVSFVPPHDSVAARQEGQALAQQIRQTLQAELNASLDEVMTSLRGRAWSS